MTLEAFTSRWITEQVATADRCNRMTGRDRTWEARQARAGARRIRRLFAGAAAITQAEFVDAFADEYERRMERGLSESRAVAEVLSNMPQAALFQQMYGSE